MSYTVQVYDIFHYHNDEPTSADGAPCASVRCLPAHSDMLVAPWGGGGWAEALATPLRGLSLRQSPVMLMYARAACCCCAHPHRA